MSSLLFLANDDTFSTILSHIHRKDAHSSRIDVSPLSFSEHMDTFCNPDASHTIPRSEHQGSSMLHARIPGHVLSHGERIGIRALEWT